MERLAINPPELKDAREIGYNHAIIADGIFYMAGQVAMDADSDIVGDDIEAQARKAYENVGILLETIGKSHDDVVKVTTHIIEPHERYYDVAIGKTALIRRITNSRLYPCCAVKQYGF